MYVIYFLSAVLSIDAMGNCCTIIHDMQRVPMINVPDVPDVPDVSDVSDLPDTHFHDSPLFEKEYRPSIPSVLPSVLSSIPSVLSSIPSVLPSIPSVLSSIPSVLPSPLFTDIIDEKHMKYMSSYSPVSELFWGIGIENETYLMRTELRNAAAFRRLRQKRERYSVDYFLNFKAEPLQKSMKQLATLESLTYPIYINSHTLQRTDHRGEHRTLYDGVGSPNPAFTESLHEQLLRDVSFYGRTYDTSVVFDGDSIEFITQQFYQTTVDTCVQELISLKRDWLAAVAPRLEASLGPLRFPDHNYGIVAFQSTYQRNMALCNNGTYHVNLTLPTRLEDGVIVDKAQFAADHLKWVEAIQMVEPLLVACYGSPDVLSLVSSLGDTQYSIGSLRVTLSRYVSLQTFPTKAPVNGKLLHCEVPEGSWYRGLGESPYHTNDVIGYDVNFNKFKNHGIELRFFDWFPEEYLADLVFFLILLGEHAVHCAKRSPRKARAFDPRRYGDIITGCVRKGFTHVLSALEVNQILEDLQLRPLNGPRTAHELLSHLANVLFVTYRHGDIVSVMAPHRTVPPVIVNYNRIAFQKLHRDLFGLPPLVLRAEKSLTEYRTPLTPSHMASLAPFFRLLVERAAHRCYSDQEYEAAGATLVEQGAWIGMSGAYVMGLKEMDGVAIRGQTLAHFAHALNGQKGAEQRLAAVRGGTFIDYEYMVDSAGTRVLSFCRESGDIGCYLALMAYYAQRGAQGLWDIGPFHRSTYQQILMEETQIHRPSVLLIGHGTVGKACEAVLKLFGITPTIWTSKSVPSVEAVRDHEILLHAIRLDKNKPVAPFFRLTDFTESMRLSVICDLTCDAHHPHNTLPLYDTYTTRSHPVRTISKVPRVDLIAIDHLPSLDPVASSNAFSAVWVKYVPELLWFPYTKRVSSFAAALERSVDAICWAL
jgi:hypothetical protein